MNIFFLSFLVEEAARAHFNKHVVKMISETMQLLSTAYWLVNPGRAPLLPTGVLWKPTHQNHPCAVWARAHPNNFRWLTLLGLALCAEYTARFSKTSSYERVHSAEFSLCFLRDNPPNFAWVVPTSTPTALNEHGLTEPPQCMPEQYRMPGDAVAAYRAYYQGAEKAALRWWRPTGMPVTRDDRDDFTPRWFKATPIRPQKNFLVALARIERKQAKRTCGECELRKRPRSEDEVE